MAERRKPEQRLEELILTLELEAAGWTQEEIAEYLGVTQATVSRDLKKAKRTYPLIFSDEQVVRQMAMLDLQEELLWRRHGRSPTPALERKAAEIALQRFSLLKQAINDRTALSATVA